MRTPLTIAASRRGRANIVRMLLDAGADLRAARPKNRTALMWAANQSDYPTFKLLLDASLELDGFEQDWREARGPDSGQRHGPGTAVRQAATG